MGDFDSSSEQTDSEDDYSSISKLAVTALALLGFLSPVLYSSYSYGSPMDYFITIQSILWSFSSRPYQHGFSFIPVYLLFSMFPFVILRLAPSAQIRRYYQGKTSRTRTFLIVLVGDIFFLVGGLMMFIMSLFSPYLSLSIPLPFQTIAGWLFLLVRPIREPVIPWEGAEESKPWWEHKKDGPPKLKMLKMIKTNCGNECQVFN
jgi:hypothetical protein